jgi:flagellar biogenesis protein FliO
LFVFALLGATLWWLRRRGLARFGGTGLPRGALRKRGALLEVVESRALGPGHALHLVRVGDRAMVLAAHGAGCTVVDVRPWGEVTVVTEDSR